MTNNISLTKLLLTDDNVLKDILEHQFNVCLDGAEIYHDMKRFEYHTENKLLLLLDASLLDVEYTSVIMFYFSTATDISEDAINNCKEILENKGLNKALVTVIVYEWCTGLNDIGFNIYKYKRFIYNSLYINKDTLRDIYPDTNASDYLGKLYSLILTDMGHYDVSNYVNVYLGLKYRHINNVLLKYIIEESEYCKLRKLLRDRSISIIEYENSLNKNRIINQVRHFLQLYNNDKEFLSKIKEVVEDSTQV